MKKNYDLSFKVEITANMIAEKFHQQLGEFTMGKAKEEDNLQRKADKLIDTVIGPMVSNKNTHGLKCLYYGLFDLDIDAPLFKDSDDLYCDKTHYGHKKIENPEYADRTDESQPEFTYKRDYVKMGNCKLIGFDTYREKNKYQIEFSKLNNKGMLETGNDWVNEDELELVSDHVDEIIAE